MLNTPPRRSLSVSRDHNIHSPRNRHNSCRQRELMVSTVYPKKYAHGFCFAVLCCGYTLTDFPISIRLTSLALWQSNDCPSASKATLMNMDKYFMWIHYTWLHNHNKQSTTKPCAYFLGYTVPRCHEYSVGSRHNLRYQRHPLLIHILNWWGDTAEDHKS